MILSEKRKTDDSPFWTSSRKRFGATEESTCLNDRVVQPGSASALTPLRKRRDGNSSSEVRFPGRLAWDFRPLLDALERATLPDCGQATTHIPVLRGFCGTRRPIDAGPTIGASPKWQHALRQPRGCQASMAPEGWSPPAAGSWIDESR